MSFRSNVVDASHGTVVTEEVVELEEPHDPINGGLAFFFVAFFLKMSIWPNGIIFHQPRFP